MNSRVPRQDTRERLHAYGLSLEIQNDILNNMSQMISEIRVIGKNTLLPFQKGKKFIFSVITVVAHDFVL